MRRTLIPVLCLALALLVPLSAQAQQALGNIQGTVSDESGAAIPGATVSIENSDTGATRTAFSGDSGFYLAKALSPGTYDVTASLEGMQTVRQEGIQVLVGQTVDVNFSLGVETVAEAITVTGEGPAIETSRSSAASYVSELEVESLPTAGRDFTDFALLTPTVQSDPVRGFVTMSGQRGIYTGLNLDGTSATSAFFGYGRGGEATENNGLVVAQDSVKEFQVVTSAFAPEYGANGGGYINVVTKSGTNQHKGSLFYLFQDDGMSEDFERSPLDKFEGDTDPVPPTAFDRTNTSFSIGGPIARDRTHYFFTGDQANRESPTIRRIRNPLAYDTIIALDATIPGIATLVDGYTRNADGTATGNFTRDVDNLIILGKIDHQISDSNTLTARVNWTDYERLSSFQDEESEKLEETTSWVLSDVAVIGSNKVNEVRLQLSTDNLDRKSQRVGSPFEAQIRVRRDPGGSFSLGKFDFLPIFVEEEKLQFQDNFSYLFGNHDLKFGVDYQEDNLAQLFAGSRDGRYDFNTLDDLVANDSSGVRIYFGDVTFPNYDETQTLIGAYAQDTFKPNANLTVNYGLRWGATMNPDNLQHLLPEARDIPDDTDNFEPRLGFTYALGGDANAIIRGGFGIFHGRTPSLLFASQVQENGLFPNFGRVFVREGQAGFVPLGQPIDNENPPLDTIPSVGFVDPSFEDAEFTRFNFGYERELGSTGWVGGADLVYAEGDSLQSNVDINRSLSFDEFGRPQYSSTRPNPNFDEQLTRQSIGRSEYQALTLKVNKRFNGRYQLQAHYTYGEDKDNDSNERSATGVSLSTGGDDRSLWNPDYDWGNAERDVKNRIVVSGLVQLPANFRISGIVESRSGRPYDPTDSSFDFPACGFTRLGFDCPNARPVVNGQVLARNSFRNDSIENIDVRVSKFFEFGTDKSVDVFFEVFNLLDDQTFGVCFGFTCDDQRDPTEPDFGLASSRITNPRVYQLGARFNF
ncbi:MAG: carboxypeptidase regulatory-like domain-containing protein [Thermoanaerobaculia bacterium]